MSKLHDNTIKNVTIEIEKIVNINTRNVVQSYFDGRIQSIKEHLLYNFAYELKLAAQKFIQIDLDEFTLNDLIFLLDEKQEISRHVYLIVSYIYMNDLCKYFVDNKSLFFFLALEKQNKYIRWLIENKSMPQNSVFNCQGNINRIVNTQGNDYIKSLLIKYNKSKNSNWMTSDSIKTISSFLVKNNVTNITESINDDFIEQYFSKNVNMSSVVFSESKNFFIWVLTQLSSEKQKIKCPLYNQILLRNGRFSIKFPNGFRPVKYNKFDKVPDLDNWIIIPNQEEILKSTRVNETVIFYFKFGEIVNTQMRLLAKKFYWDTENSINTKYNDHLLLIKFLNTYFSKKDEKYTKIRTHLLMEYKLEISNTHKNPSTRRGYLVSVLNFIKYLDVNKFIEVDNHAYMFLSLQGVVPSLGAKDISKEDLTKLAVYLSEHKYDSLDNLIIYTIFYITANSEFRISQICTLTTNCIQETMKKNEFMIKCITKVSAGEVVEQPISRNLKKFIDEFIYSTTDFRETITNDKLKQYMFVRKNPSGNAFRLMDTRTFSLMLEDICKEIGINKITSKNIRATYITDGYEKLLRDGESDTVILANSNHINMSTIQNHYLQFRIKEALEVSNNIIIGNVNLYGQIVVNPNDIKSKKENAVEDECGYCQSDFCELNGPISCLLCSKFATTIDRIPFFERHIESFNERISSSTIRHDVEDYVNLKRLFAKYLEELLKIKEVSKNAAN